MKKNRFFHIAITFLAALSFSSNVLAGPPSGGSILREEEQQKIQKTIDSMQPTPPSEDIATPPEPKRAPGVKVFVKRIEFAGYDSLISLKELNKIAAPYIGKETTLTGLESLAYEITKYSRKQSGLLLLRAYFPEQDVTDGVIKIIIVPGSLDGKIKVSVKEPYRINKRLLENMAERAVPEDQAIRVGAMERAVLLINELPGISSRAYLDKGDTPGTTKVSIDAKEREWLTGMIYLDNFGNKSTGAFRRIAQVSLGDTFHCGDLIQIMYINSDDLNQGIAHLSFPVGDRGLFADFTCNGLYYKLGDKLKDLDADGHAITGNAALRYPIILRRTADLWIGAGYDYFYLNDKIFNTSYSARDINAGNAYIKGNIYDGFFGGGFNYFLVSLNGGDVSLNAGKEYDDVSACTNGGYFRATYLGARLQRATKCLSLLFSIRGQVSSCNLDTSQKIIIGGPTGVRAYPVGEAAADEGNIMTFETRLDLPFMPSWLKTQLIGFYDAGYAVLHKDKWINSVTTATGRNRYWMQGAGSGINIGKQGLCRMQFSYALKIGNNPGRDASGNDTDGRSDDGRFWLQGTVWF
ncbi:MAG: POTRA domain-containing protein [Thermodesulfobacteriota bacterium]|nr:POTRA domain-containing protein [Thermodesulfobacteriota bacterium]